MKYIFKVGISIFLVGIVVAIYIYVPYDPPKWTVDEIRSRVDLLNEAAAVDTPHNGLDDGETRAQHLALFEAVERGAELSDAQSAEYRTIYQGILKRNQGSLKLFDSNLTVLTDVGMDQDNNVGGKGIAGAHDHHDASARSNFKDLSASLQRIRSASGVTSPFVRIKNAIYAYKDVTDIVLHLATAPHTKSVPHVPAQNRPADSLSDDFETVLREFKLAQFEPVNSKQYIKHIHNALDRYDQMILKVQEIVYGNLSTLERTIAGRWGAWQSFGPPVGGLQANRIPRSR